MGPGDDAAGLKARVPVTAVAVALGLLAASAAHAQSVCDAIYAEARDQQSCLAYEAYVLACDDHPLLPIGRLFVERFCAQAAADPSTPAAKTATGPAPTAESAPPASFTLLRTCMGEGEAAARFAACAAVLEASPTSREEHDALFTWFQLAMAAQDAEQAMQAFRAADSRQRRGTFISTQLSDLASLLSSADRHAEVIEIHEIIPPSARSTHDRLTYARALIATGQRERGVDIAREVAEDASMAAIWRDFAGKILTDAGVGAAEALEPEAILTALLTGEVPEGQPESVATLTFDNPLIKEPLKGKMMPSERALKVRLGYEPLRGKAEGTIGELRLTPTDYKMHGKPHRSVHAMYGYGASGGLFWELIALFELTDEGWKLEDIETDEGYLTTDLALKEIAACQDAAGHPDDPQQDIRGVAFDDIDPERAIAACRAAVDMAPFDLGPIYNLGRAYDKAGEYIKAADAYLYAAKRGYLQAMVGYAILLENGDGLEKSEADAFLAFQGAADLGHPYALYKVGKYLASGEVVSRDDRGAFEAFVEAANRGQVRAMVEVGYRAGRGIGTARNPDVALAYYRQAAEAGSSVAHWNLAVLLDKGQDLTPDRKAAGAHLYEAILAGSKTAIERIGAGKGSFQPETIKELQVRLTRRGVYSGTIDGILGEGTARAVKTLAKM